MLDKSIVNINIYQHVYMKLSFPSIRKLFPFSIDYDYVFVYYLINAITDYLMRPSVKNEGIILCICIWKYYHHFIVRLYSCLSFRLWSTSSNLGKVLNKYTFIILLLLSLSLLSWSSIFHQTIPYITSNQANHKPTNHPSSIIHHPLPVINHIYYHSTITLSRHYQSLICPCCCCSFVWSILITLWRTSSMLFWRINFPQLLPAPIGTYRGNSLV